MSVSARNAFIGQLATTFTAIGTCDGNARFGQVRKFTAVNTLTTSVTVDVHKVPTGGSATATNMVINDKALSSKETYDFPEVVGKILDPGDAIEAKASLATQVTADCDLIEVY